MPIYEYLCEACSHEFDTMCCVDKRKDACEEPCPECGKKKVILKISQTQIIDPFVLGLQKPTSSFNEVMKHHKKKFPRGNWKV